MYKNMSLKLKIIIATAITISSFILLGLSIVFSTKYINKLNNVILNLEKVQKDLVLLRNSEKNFFERKDLLYKLEFESNIYIIYTNLDALKMNLLEFDIDTQGLMSFENRIKLYENLFINIVKKYQVIGLDENEGLYHELSETFNKIKKDAKVNNSDLLFHLYELKKIEQDFTLTHDTMYIDAFKIKMNQLLSQSDLLTKNNKEMLVQYKDTFSMYEKELKEIGLKYNSGMYEKMRRHINRSSKIQAKISDDLVNIVKEKIQLIEYATLIVCAILAFIILTLAISIIRTVLGPVSKLLGDYKDIVDEGTIVSKTNDKGIITYVNDQFCEISGYTRDELLGMHHNIVRHPDTPKEIFRDLWDTIKNKKQTWKGKIKNRKKNGDSYWVKSTIKPILNNRGEIVEFIAIRADITEIEKNKEHLKKQYSITSEKYEDVVKLSSHYEDAMEKSNIIIRISNDLIITYVNENFSDQTGYTIDELIGKPYKMLIHKDFTDENVQDMFKDSEEKGIWKGQLKGFTKEGKEIHFTTTIIPIKDKNDKTIEYMAIRNDITKVIELHNELEFTQREILYTIGEIAESRSQETGQHVKRVAKYSKLLALKAGLNEEEANNLLLASPMHDIGKLAIPDSILNKPGRLTPEEFEKMKEHASIGYSLLNKSKREIFKAAAIVSHEHHEKWDGSGYPRGLKGSDIHIYGRITAICDVFDALAHERPYKKAWEIERILELFKEQKGKHFDPNLIDIFFRDLDDFLEIKNMHDENKKYA